MKITLVVGTRPNIIKITQFRKVFESYTNYSLQIIHSNQHYSDLVSTSLFEQLNVKVDVYLPKYEGDSVGHIGFIISELNKEIQKSGPDLVIAVGDVNTTLAAAIVANKLGIKLAHLEGGLRSFDVNMPEEINRILVDNMANYFFVTEKSGIENLLSEGKSKESIFFVGNTMIDTLVAFRDVIASKVLPFEIEEGTKVLTLTLHRPSNVDTIQGLNKVIHLLEECSNEYLIVFPIHHRTKKQMDNFNLTERLTSIKNLKLIDPLDYISFQKLISVSYAIVTDSGGIQEETTFLKVPCITLRKNTERPSTIDQGTNVLLDFDPKKILERLESIDNLQSEIPELWDGKSTERIVSIISNILG